MINNTVLYSLQSYIVHLHNIYSLFPKCDRAWGGSMSWVVGLPNNSYKPITNMAWVCARLCKLQKWVHSTYTKLQLQVLSLPVACPWSVVLRVLRLLPPLKLVAMIQLKVALKHQNVTISMWSVLCCNTGLDLAMG